MADKPDELQYWADLRKQLTPGSLARIDFDELDRHIETVIGSLTTRSQRATELALLRTDLELRLKGLLKAIAVAERSGNGLEAVSVLIDQISDLNADDLLRQYKATSARFRDLFPGSLALQRSLGETPNTRIDPDNYK